MSQQVFILLSTLIILLSHNRGYCSKTVKSEFCHFETLNATCSDGFVVIIQSAQYGRMSLGRCIDTDVYIGCSGDVTSDLDARCSGRPHCLVSIPDSSLHQQHSCPSDMMSYLEVSYKCVRVIREDASCGEYLLLDSDAEKGENVGFFSSYTARQTGYGSQRCPWSLKAKKGQKIELQLLDYSQNPRYNVDRSAVASGPVELCSVYATITSEGEKPREMTSCAGVGGRERAAVISLGDKVTVTISDQAIFEQSVNFVIRYSAVGCEDMTAPKKAIVKRVNDRTTVTCNSSAVTWHLICRGNKWIGQENANQCDIGPRNDKIIQSFPAYGLLTAVLTGIVIGALCGFSLLALVMWCKRRSSNRRRLYKYGEAKQVRSSSRDEARLPEDNLYPSTPPCKLHHRLNERGDYEYTHVWGLGPNNENETGLIPVAMDTMGNSVMTFVSRHNDNTTPDTIIYSTRMMPPSPGHKANYEAAATTPHHIHSIMQSMPQNSAPAGYKQCCDAWADGGGEGTLNLHNNYSANSPIRRERGAKASPAKRYKDNCYT